MIAFATKVYNKHFTRCRVDRDDLIMEGVVGILDYQGNYDENKGTLATYLWKCAYCRMLTFYREQKKYFSHKDEIDKAMYVETNEKNPLETVFIYDDMGMIENYKGDSKFKRGIVDDVIKLGSQNKVAKKHGITHQYVSLIWRKFISDVRENCEMVDGVIEHKKEKKSGCCRELS